MCGTTLRAAVLVVLAAARPCLADDANSSYNSLFGAEDRKVRASASTLDDAQFAAKLLDSAKAVGDSRAMQLLLLDKAAQFGVSNPKGYAVAAEALAMLASLAPDRKQETDDRLLKLRELQYRDAPPAERAKAGLALVDDLVAAANRRLDADQPADALDILRRSASIAQAVRSSRRQEIQDLITEAGAQEAVARQIDRAEKLLARDPNDHDAARRLMMLYLIERDDPNRAAALLGRAEPGEPVKTLLPLAARKLEDLAASVVAEMGDWYLSLWPKASAAARESMLDRAQACYERFLEVHRKNDERTLAVRARLEEIAKKRSDSAHGAGRRIGGRFAACADGRARLYADGKRVLTAEPGQGLAEARGELGPGSVLVVAVEAQRGAGGFAAAFESQGYAMVTKAARWKVLADVKADGAATVTAAAVHKAGTPASPGGGLADQRRDIARRLGAEPEVVAPPKQAEQVVLATVVEESDFARTARPASDDQQRATVDSPPWRPGPPARPRWRPNWGGGRGHRRH